MTIDRPRSSNTTTAFAFGDLANTVLNKSLGNVGPILDATMTSAPYNPSQTASDGPAWSANPAENRKLKPDSLSGGREAVQHPNTATRRTAGDHVGLLPIADLPQRPRATSLPGVRIEVLNVGRRSTDAESSRTADQGVACGAAGPAPAPGSALGRPARRKPATPAGSQIKGGSFVTRSGTARSRLPHSGIVQLAATASMAAVRAVAGDRLRRPWTRRPLTWVGRL